MAEDKNVLKKLREATKRVGQVQQAAKEAVPAEGK
jgi:hypothetical protein